VPALGSARLTPLTTRLRRGLRRHRRLLAALLAGAAVLVALSVLRTPAAPAEASEAGPSAPPGVAAGQVAVPILLSSTAVARTLSVGDVIDVVGITGDESATATVVAPDARVIEIPEAGSTFSAAAAAVVVVAVREGDALPLLAASASGALSILIRQG